MTMQENNMYQNNLEIELINLKGKHIKNVLTRLEQIDSLTPQIRKIVLDELNDLMREVLRQLGFEVAD